MTALLYLRGSSVIAYFNLLSVQHHVRTLPERKDEASLCVPESSRCMKLIGSVHDISWKLPALHCIIPPGF